MVRYHLKSLLTCVLGVETEWLRDSISAGRVCGENREAFRAFRRGIHMLRALHVPTTDSVRIIRTSKGPTPQLTSYTLSDVCNERHSTY